MTVSGDEMHKPSWFSTNVNAGNLITLAVIIGGAIYGYGGLNSRLTAMETATAARTAEVNTMFANISRSLENLPALTYRVTANEEAIKGVVQRTDSSIANISNRLGEINVAIGGLNTNYAVLAQRIDGLTPQQRSELERRLALNAPRE